MSRMKIEHVTKNERKEWMNKKRKENRNVSRFKSGSYLKWFFRENGYQPTCMNWETHATCYNIFWLSESTRQPEKSAYGCVCVCVRTSKTYTLVEQYKTDWNEWNVPDAPIKVKFIRFSIKITHIQCIREAIRPRFFSFVRIFSFFMYIMISHNKRVAHIYMLSTIFGCCCSFFFSCFSTVNKFFWFVQCIRSWKKAHASTHTNTMSAFFGHVETKAYARFNWKITDSVKFGEWNKKVFFSKCERAFDKVVKFGYRLFCILFANELYHQLVLLVDVVTVVHV